MMLYQEPKLASDLMEGHLSINRNPSRKDLIVNFLLPDIFSSNVQH